MGARILSGATLSVAALGVAMAFGPSASASSPHGVSVRAPRHQSSPVTPAKTCYAQTDNDNGLGIDSQNFEPSLDAFDSQGVDDFTISRKCKLKTVFALGIYEYGTGPADSYRVMFYSNDGGSPGAVVLDRPTAAFTDTTGYGSPEIRVRTTLKKGTYWLSIQANMDFSSGGEWDWYTNNTVRGNASLWENPGDGFDTGCTTYTTTTTCIPGGEGGDFSFSLQ
jgi:hypothetical protein